jgi:hypothetical protein
LAAQAPTAQPPTGLQTPHWSLASRVAFRFCFLYFGLFCVATQIIVGLVPINIEIPGLSALWPMRQITFWTGAHVFHARLPLVFDSGSGDETFDWALVLWLLVLAVLATGIWSVLDRKRDHYATLYKWFRLFLRFALAGQMFGYGLYKLIPLQMPFPHLATLLEPYRNFSPMGVLWSSIGASPAYETFAGCAETLGGLLLVVPRTAMLGALVCLADMTQVFALNMTYDVPVKLFSFHLLLMALFLLAPDLRRLADFFFRQRTVGPSTEAPLFASRLANRIALAAQVLFAVSMLGMGLHGAFVDWHRFGGGRPKSPLYGIWNVDELSIDGQVRSPLVTDNGRWRRAIFDFPTGMAFQRMDDSFARYGCSINASAGTLALTKGADKSWRANFTFQRPAQNQLVLDGSMDNQKVHMQLQLMDRSRFMLVSRGFHWVQEAPFNR